MLVVRTKKTQNNSAKRWSPVQYLQNVSWKAVFHHFTQ